MTNRPKRIDPLSARRSRLNPVHQRLDLLGGKALVVLELSNMGISVPRRHAVGPDRFPDHRREAFNGVVVRHREGSDAALLVTGHALFLEDRRNILDVRDLGDGRLRLRRAIREVDQAAVGLNLRRRIGLARDHGVERLRRIIAGGLGFLGAIGH